MAKRQPTAKELTAQQAVKRAKAAASKKSRARKSLRSNSASSFSSSSSSSSDNVQMDNDQSIDREVVEVVDEISESNKYELYSTASDETEEDESRESPEHVNEARAEIVFNSQQNKRRRRHLEKEEAKRNETNPEVFNLEGEAEIHVNSTAAEPSDENHDEGQSVNDENVLTTSLGENSPNNTVFTHIFEGIARKKATNSFKVTPNDGSTTNFSYDEIMAHIEYLCLNQNKQHYDALFDSEVLRTKVSEENSRQMNLDIIALRALSSYLNARAVLRWDHETIRPYERARKMFVPYDYDREASILNHVRILYRSRTGLYVPPNAARLKEQWRMDDRLGIYSQDKREFFGNGCPVPIPGGKMVL